MCRSPAVSLALLVSACGADAPPPDPAALAYRAAVEGEHEAAAAHYADATEARPDDVGAWSGLSRERLRAGVDAVGAAERAVELNDSADSQELLGRALLAGLGEEAGKEERAERAADAVAALERALELDPERARLHFALGRAREAADRKEAAIEAYRASAEAGVLPARALVAAVRLRLDVLGAEPISGALGDELEAELDRADGLAEGDQAAGQALAAQRRRLERKRSEPDLSALGAGLMDLDGDLGVGGIGLGAIDGLFEPIRAEDLELEEPAGFGELSVGRGFGGDSGRGRGTIGIGTLGTGHTTMGGGRGGRRLDER